MKTAIIGGGKGCRAILEMIVQKRLQILSPKIMCVVDLNPNASGMLYAREQGWETCSSIEYALNLPGLELVIELTGRDDVLDEIYHLIRPGIRVMDHVLARVFWDLDRVKIDLREELERRIALEVQLQEDRNQLQQILDSLPEAVMVVNRSMILERVNARFYELTGMKTEEVECHDCIDPFCRKHITEEGRVLLNPFKQVLDSGKPMQYVYFEPGEHIPEGYYEITSNPIFDEKGNIAKVVETVRPITEQVMLKRETEESERRFRQFIENAHDMITIKDLEGKYLVVNPKAASLFGKRPEELIGKSDFEIFPEKVAKILSRKDKRVIEKMEHCSYEETLVINGERRYFHSVRFPLLDYKGDISGVCTISRDITEQKNLQRAIVQSEKLAAVGKLAAGVAHELNNPLTGILSFAEELKLDMNPEDPMRHDIEVIIRETMRCRQIVRDLMDYAKLEKPHRQKININRVVERSLSLVQKQAAFHDITFDIRLSDNLPDVSIDPNQMQQVFLNLIINAAEAMNNVGKITIESRTLNDKRTVETVVIDRGHGIPADRIQQIFEPFYSTKGQQGNGLGLSVVQSIVEQHGGKIEVESEVGKGSSFKIILPSVSHEGRSIVDA